MFLSRLSRLSLSSVFSIEPLLSVRSAISRRTFKLLSLSQAIILSRLPAIRRRQIAGELSESGPAFENAKLSVPPPPASRWLTMFRNTAADRWLYASRSKGPRFLFSLKDNAPVIFFWERERGARAAVNGHFSASFLSQRAVELSEENGSHPFHYHLLLFSSFRLRDPFLSSIHHRRCNSARQIFAVVYHRSNSRLGKLSLTALRDGQTTPAPRFACTIIFFYPALLFEKLFRRIANAGNQREAIREARYEW